MNTNMIINADFEVPVCSPEIKKQREQQIKDILARGKIVVFTYPTGVKKYLTEWNIDADGDLKAAYSTGLNDYICWDGNRNITISEVDKIPV